jgi:hypothetical protein
VYVIWLDEARARMALELAHAGYAATTGAAGAKPHEIPEHTDPADEFAGAGEPPARSADPAERAAQVRAFLAAAGDAGETATVP